MTFKGKIELEEVRKAKSPRDPGKPPRWFWPVWTISALLTVGFFGLVIWLVVLGIQWLSTNT